MSTILFSIYTATLSVSLGYMECGENAVLNEDWNKATYCYTKALDSYGLSNNYAGRFICYWNIHLAESHLKNVDKSMDALLGFIVYGSLFNKEYPNMFEEEKKEFGLFNKLNYSISLLQAVWASENKYSCRSELYPCYLPDPKLISVFKNNIPFCEKGLVLGLNSKKDNELLVVSAQCTGDKEKYFFTDTP